MGANNRDDFRKKTKFQIAMRVGWLCSYPSCRESTVGANSDGGDEINVGVAAHISAAAPGGPRYDPEMTPDQRRSPDNGIWLCQDHAKALDSDDSEFTVENLRRWKEGAQKESFHRVMRHGDAGVNFDVHPSDEELSRRLRAAAAADLAKFRNSERWSSTAIERTLDVEELRLSIDTPELARGLITLGDLVLVAPPGMGKTTTVFQVAEAALEANAGLPIIVPLGNWSANQDTLLGAILRRPAFRTFSDEDFRSAAARPGVFLLLDGWNELDSASRLRVAAETEDLQLELPGLGFVVATREERGVAPIDGRVVRLRPLNERQQLDIAGAVRGDAGEGMVHRAWHTPGVRELITVPLYLTALLALPEDVQFPQTKEELLRQFVAVHEKDYQRSEALAEATDDLHARYLQGLAETATRAANTTIGDSAARKSVVDAAAALEVEGQISGKPKPNVVLDVLVNHHVLVREREPAGYSFQHQQFQEWYASKAVEDLMAEAARNHNSRGRLKADVLNQRVWEEPILFACERLARGDDAQQEICGETILAALEVDPMLTAEMIWRSSDGVWRRVGPSVEDFVELWHTPGTVDRAVRFMCISGRAEFREHVWPLITHENDQIHLAVFDAGTRFRPSVLGKDAALRLQEVCSKLRQTILGEIAMYGAMDGIDFAADVATVDRDPEVKAKVAEALAYRGVDRHVARVLRDAEEATFDLLTDGTLFDGIADDGVRLGLAAAREREHASGIPRRKRLKFLVSEYGGEDASVEVTKIIAEMEFERGEGHADYLVDLASVRFPEAVAKGLIRRVCEGRELPRRATGMLFRAGLGLENEILLKVALESDRSRDGRAEAATSVLGPQAVGRMIDRMVELREQIDEVDKAVDKATRDLHNALQERICFAESGHVLAAIQERAGQATNRRVEYFANLINRYGDRSCVTRRGFDAAGQGKIAHFVRESGERLLSTGDATRSQLAAIASLVRHEPSGDLLPGLERLFDEEIRLLAEFQEKARTGNDHRGEARQETRRRWSFHYQNAFAAICCPESTALMQKYLMGEEYGYSAAFVLAAHWRARNDLNDDKLWPRPSIFSHFAKRQAAHKAAPGGTCVEAEAIFGAIEQLTSTGATDAQMRRAVRLATVATSLPHGTRYDTIKGLIAIAEPQERRILLTNLALACEVIDIELVKRFIREFVETARTQYWTDQEEHELSSWLSLLPFTTNVSETVDIVQTVPERHRNARALDQLFEALTHAPGDDAEEVVFALAEADPELHGHRAWLDSVVQRGTLSSAKRLIDLAAEGALNRKDGMGGHEIYTRLARLIGEHPELRARVYGLLDSASSLPGRKLLAQTVAENPDEEGFLRLIELEIAQKHDLAAWLHVERVVSERVFSHGEEGSYNLRPVPANEVRRKLLAMARDGGPNDIAARYLNQIDELRDQLGTSDFEPRHPDLVSGKAWPILTAVQDASNEG